MISHCHPLFGPESHRSQGKAPNKQCPNEGVEGCGNGNGQEQPRLVSPAPREPSGRWKLEEGLPSGA